MRVIVRCAQTFGCIVYFTDTDEELKLKPDILGFKTALLSFTATVISIFNVAMRVAIETAHFCSTLI